MADTTEFNTIQAVIKIRREKEAYYNQVKSTFIPADGELCLVDTTQNGLMMKVGNGTATWEVLSYFNQAVLQGYYDEETNIFWADQEKTTLMDITKSALYIDLRSGNRIYYWNGATYVLLAGGGSGGSTDVDLATASTAGIMKLYDNIKGENLDGTVTQKAIYEAIKQRIGAEVDESQELLIIGEMGEVDPSTGSTTVVEYIPGHDYLKDTIVYFGDRVGIVMKDFIADNTGANDTDCWNADITAGNILVDKISIDELDEQLLKAIPIVAFVSKRDIPRFETDIKIAGTVPTFRDGTHLTTEEKEGCNFFYVVDNNDKLTGLALVLNYDVTADEFTCNAMKYGVGTADNILPADNILTQRNVGGIQIVAKDDLLKPKFVIKSTPPIDNTNLWFESTALDASEIEVGMVPVKKYNDATLAWDITETIPIEDSEIVKNGNGSEWQYYRIYTNGNVFVSLALWQLVFDANQILGKIIEINSTDHEITIQTIHANDIAEPFVTKDVTTNVDIGGIPSGTTIEEGTTLTQLVELMANKDIPAEFNFSASDAGVYKVGDTVNSSTLEAELTDLGNMEITKVVFYANNIIVNEQDYVAGTSTYTYNYNVPITSNTTFAAAIKQGDNVGEYKTARFEFVIPSYIGVVNTLTPTEADITGLTAVQPVDRKGEYTVSMADNRTCYAYPASYGDLIDIKDVNGFGYINSFTKTTITINSILYNVYVLTEPVTASNFTWIFS